MDNQAAISVGELLLGKKSKVQATITSIRHHRIKNGSTMTDAVIGDETASVKCVWFSKSPLYDLKVGNEYVFEGVLEHKYGRLALQKPTYKLVKENQQDYQPVQPQPYIPRTYKRRSSYTSASDIGSAIAGIIIVGYIGYALISWIYTTIHNRQLHSEGQVTCKDVTSIDYNWNNDVLCTNPDGTTFYTNYAGGNKYGYHFPN